MRTSWIIVLAACLMLVTGCQRGGGPASPETRKYQRVQLRYGLELPPGISADTLTPLTGESLAKAKLTTDQVLAPLPRPDFLDAVAQPDGLNEDVEPPLAAQKAYVAGRIAWRVGDMAEAKQQLEAALRLAPNEPRLLRLLGEIYTRSGNRIKGAQYFRRAVDLAPEDARSLFILGRFAVEKGDHDEAAVLFHDILIREQSPSALAELSRHFLGNTLRNMGHDGASAEQFEQYIAVANGSISSSIYAREQALLRRQIGVTRQLLGDLYMRLDRPADAIGVYREALEAGVPDAVKLDKRRVYAALRLRDDLLAQRLVIEQVQRRQGDAQALAMVRYIVNQGVPSARVAEALRLVYEEQGRPESLAIATADVLPTDQARVLLTDHLAQAPEDRRAYYILLHNYLLPESQAPHTQKSLERAVELTAALMAQTPQIADAYGTALVTHIQDPQALLDVIGYDDQADELATMRIVLRGLCMAVLERYDEAQAQFELAVKREPDLAVARVELAKALIVQDDFDAAAEVLEPLADSTHTAVILLRANVLAKTGNAEEAILLIDRVIRETGGDVRLVITQANLELALGRASDAERTLLDALNAEPKSEVLYAALLDLYDPEPGQKSAIEDQTAKWRVLVKRLLGTIPNSRTGRLVQAQLHEASRSYDRAAQILEGLLAENPNDGKALDQLLDTYHAAGRTGEAVALIEDRLAASPEDLRLLRMAQRFYNTAGDQERLFDIQERILMLEPPGPVRAGQLGFLYRQWGKYQQSVDVLEEALQAKEIENPVLLVSLLSSTLSAMDQHELAEQRISEAAKRFADHEAELMYLLAVTVNSQGDMDRGEQVMRDLLAKFPDHGPANNGLGYAMLMRNEDPAKALTMIQRAVDSDPTSEAYLDSLGWAYYKLEKFEDAEVWLRKAREAAIARVRAEGPGGTSTATLAIVSDHLADTLYRLGREPEALRTWSSAAAHLRGAKPEDLKQDPELATLEGRLREKISAVRGKIPVPVADLPEKPKPVEEPKPAPEPKPAAPKADGPPADASKEAAPRPKKKAAPKKEPAKKEPVKKDEPKPAEPPAEPKAEKPKPEPKPEPKKPEAAAKPEPEPEPDAKSESKPKAEPKPEPAPKPAEKPKSAEEKTPDPAPETPVDPAAETPAEAPPVKPAPAKP